VTTEAEQTGNPPTYPSEGTYADFLHWHMKYWGTRPTGNKTLNGQPWGDMEFRQAVFGNKSEDRTADVSLRNWLGAGYPPLPASAKRVADTFFGDNPAFIGWKEDFEAAHSRSSGTDEYKKKKNKRTLTFPDPPPIVVPKRLVPSLAIRFLGRDNDVEMLVSTLLQPDTRAILIQGGPGIGKTELTKAVAHHENVVKRFGERRWFVSLETEKSDRAMQGAIRVALGYDPSLDFQTLLKTLHGKQTLLVLDNLETPWESPKERVAVESVLADLAAVPGLSILASFRGLEKMRGFRWTLEYPLKPLADVAAIDLFVDIAGPTVRNDPKLGDFIEALGGIPLAIELVAHHAYGETTLLPLWEEWERIGAKLARHPDFQENRLTSLPRSIELSLSSVRMKYHSAQRLFGLLGHLPAGLNADDCKALIGDDAFDARRRLFRVGLSVEQADRTNLLPPIREHAKRRYKLESEDAHRWPEYFLTKAAKLDRLIATAGGKGILDQLLPDFRNIEAALRANREDVPKAKLMDAVNGFAQLAVFAAQETNIFEEFAASFRAESDSKNEAECLKIIGDAAQYRSNFVRARSSYQMAIEKHREHGNLAAVADCLNCLGDIAIRLSDLDAADDILRESLEIYISIQNRWGEANCLRSLGDVAANRTDYDTARTRYLDSLERQRRIGNTLGEANCLHSLGTIALAIADHDTARANFQSAQGIYREIGDRRGQAHCIRSLADISLFLSDYDVAEKYYDEAIEIYKSGDDLIGEALCIQKMGAIYLHRSCFDKAGEANLKAMDLFRIVGSSINEASSMTGIGDVLIIKCKYDEARDYFYRAMNIFDRTGNVSGSTYCLMRLSEIHLFEGEANNALPGLEKALSAYEEIGDAVYAASCARSLGDIASAKKDYGVAETFYHKSLARSVEIKSKSGQAACWASLGDISFFREDFDTARPQYEKARDLYVHIGNRWGEANCLMRLGDVTACLGEYDGAKEKFIQSLAIYEAIRDSGGQEECQTRLKEIENYI